MAADVYFCWQIEEQQVAVFRPLPHSHCDLAIYQWSWFSQNMYHSCCRHGLRRVSHQILKSFDCCEPGYRFPEDFLPLWSWLVRYRENESTFWNVSIYSVLIFEFLIRFKKDAGVAKKIHANLEVKKRIYWSIEWNLS